MTDKMALSMRSKHRTRQEEANHRSAQIIARNFMRMRRPRPREEELVERIDEESNDEESDVELVDQAFERERPVEPEISNDGSDVEPVEQLSERRKAVARGKRPAEPEINEEEGENRDGKPQEARRAARRSKEALTEEDFLDIFQGMNFVGTRYPHRETMEQLGILRDVEYLFEISKLATFMSYELDAYQEETCHFLASLKVHFYEEDMADLVEEGGMGYITFKIRDEEFGITLKQLDELFRFPTGGVVEPDYDKEELSALWQTIGGAEAYSSSRSKSAQIRSPVLRYVHKALANTFCARRVTGNINERELQLMDAALKDLLGATKDGRAIEGDRSDTGLTMVLLDQLLSYRDWASTMHKRGSKGELCMGGIVTAILHASGVDLKSQPIAPRHMDINYLTKTRFLYKKKVNEQYIYQFIHPEAGEAKLTLPNMSLTKIRMGENIDFCPPLEFLYDSTAPKHLYQDPADTAENNEDDESERYYFEDYTAPRQGKGLKEAHKRISLLQKWNKWQSKTIKSLKTTVKELTSGMKEVKGQIKELQNKFGSSSTRHGITGLGDLGRSRSVSIQPRRNIPMEPARASSFEPGQRKSKSRGEAGPSSISRLDQHDVELKQNAPAYTQASMEESIDSFFTHP